MLKTVKKYDTPFDSFIHSYITIDEIEHYDPVPTMVDGKKAYKTGEWLDRDDCEAITRFTCIHNNCNHPSQGHPVFNSVAEMEEHVNEHLKNGDT